MSPTPQSTAAAGKTVSSPDEPLGRPMPQNVEAERSVLGAVLVDNHALNSAIEKLRPEDFYLDQHQRIFIQMIAMGEEQKPIDLVTLCDQLRRKGELEAAGGPAYVAQLVDGVPRVSHLEYYGRIVKEKAQFRRVITATRTIQQAAHDEDDAVLERATASLAEIRANQGSPGADYLQMFHSSEDFEKSSDLTFAIDGFLQTDAATMIAGLSGEDKTFIMLSMNKALLTGRKLWNLFNVNERAARCIYLVPESALGPFKHRVELFGLMEFVRSERLLVRTLSKGPTPCLSDPRILYASKVAHVFLDTAVRFSTEGDENSAGDNQRGLAADIFALLGAGARSVTGAHHAPKSFATQTTMTLENILRGSGDIGAMLATCWGLRQLDKERNVVYVQNCKPRDFEPCGPFQLIGRPHIDTEGDFRIHKWPGESRYLQDELKLGRDQGGAPAELRDQRQQRIAAVQDWLKENPSLTRNDVVERFQKDGVKVSYATAKDYLAEIKKGRL